MYSPVPDTCDIMDRRQGLKRKAEGMQESHKQIEKRRRDRINQSLMELSQVIPATFAKQSSRRLEKAEILEMTVHYIRAISSTDVGLRFEQGDWYSSDIWGDFIHHYQSGYSDCMRELHRFYRAVEGRPDRDDEMHRVFSFLQSRYRADASVADGEAFRARANNKRPSELYNRSPEPTDTRKHADSQPRMISALTRNHLQDVENQQLQHTDVKRLDFELPPVIPPFRKPAEIADTFRKPAEIADTFRKPAEIADTFRKPAEIAESFRTAFWNPSDIGASGYSPLSHFGHGINALDTASRRTT